MGININVYLNSLKQKGNLAYEYNPFHNYQTNEDLLINNGFYIPKGKAVNKYTGEVLTENGDDCWYDKFGIKVDTGDILKYDINNSPDIRKGSLMDLDTTNFNFDLEHPVDIEVLPSYDGSVNLILNDGKNIPRLINSRFSVREKNTYEIVDRIGENDTNIYSSDDFDKDTSLYFKYLYNPIIEYKGLVNGVLPVGQYCFYFTYADSDNNESDIITESGLIPVFIGNDKDPLSIDGGIKNLATNKGIKLKLTNLDASYNYLKVCYVRYFADYNLNRVYECKKIYLKYPVNSNKLILQITGNEETEDLDPNILNLSRFNPQSVVAQAQCKNILFFGNIVKNVDNYKELQDCALRITPSILKSSINTVNNKYIDSTGDFGYYNSYNIYNKVGYFNQEYYRFGVVFIYQDGTLSNVYNTLGYDLKENVGYNDTIYSSDTEELLSRHYITIDDFGWVINNGEFETTAKLNSKGVCKINCPIKKNEIIGIKFNVPDEVKEFLKTLKIRGLFFVRQKRQPNLISQCYLMPMDEILLAPIIEIKNGNKTEYKTECFITKRDYHKEKIPFGTKTVDEGGLLNNSYEDRLYNYDTKVNENISKNAYAAICPDFLLNQPYYNLIFNGSKFKLKKFTEDAYLVKDGRYYNLNLESKLSTDTETYNATICSVTEDVSSVALENKVYKLEMGKSEEVFRFKYAQFDNSTYSAGSEDKIKINTASNIVRGMYSPYLAIYSSSTLKTGEIYNIYLDNFLDDEQLYLNRMNSSEPFYAISDRYNFNLLNDDNVYYRGDCYLNTFTYRLNRNFNDSSLANNDLIIDKNSWRDNYDAFNSEKWKNISRSDVNAVMLGSWITINIQSYMNYAFRSEDFSYVAERALMGSPRSFYPRKQMMWLGNHKMPDSYLYNDAYRASLGFKCYFTLLDINYIKNNFSNRIQYSEIAILDSYKNNYRNSLSTYFRDYSIEYGSITKLVGFEGYLLVVFEHAIAIAVVNERILAGNGDGEPVFINTNNVLPEELTIITDTYGTQWPESVIKSEAGYVYGIDTIAKKIWRIKGQQIEILSDFKVNNFLNDNITLGERELYPIVGLKNVKTHYNNNKKDIMFTFYDDIYKDEEKVWNLCYNELLEEFVTFYSWVPSYSENIDTLYFSFNRETSKGLTLLNKSNYHISKNSGILVGNPILKQGLRSNKIYLITKLYYRDSQFNNIENVRFVLEKDHWQNYKLFTIVDNELFTQLYNKEEILSKMKENNQKVLLFYVSAYDSNSNLLLKNQVIAVTFKKIVDNSLLENEDYEIPNLTTDFYLHGKSGIIDIQEALRPTYWYGEQHPFEFEFVVNDNIGYLKIFTNLILISNKAEPESFHFEIEGDNYEFSSDKRTMYFRQEATKELYQKLGSNIIFDRNYRYSSNLAYTLEQYYRGDTIDSKGFKHNYSDYEINHKNGMKVDKYYPVEGTGLVQSVKSNIFPLYYERIDNYNLIYHSYSEMMGDKYDFKNLSGSEIKWIKNLNQFNVITHIKNSPIDLVGRLRGNSRYKEGKWNILIPSIIFMLKNEEEWEDVDEQDYGRFIPPLVINSLYVPSDITNNVINQSVLPNIYCQDNYQEHIDLTQWSSRKEAKIRDKWIKIRVRYSGKNLAIIHSIATLYNISYS